MKLFFVFIPFFMYYFFLWKRRMYLFTPTNLRGRSEGLAVLEGWGGGWEEDARGGGGGAAAAASFPTDEANAWVVSTSDRLIVVSDQVREDKGTDNRHLFNLCYQPIPLFPLFPHPHPF